LKHVSKNRVLTEAAVFAIEISSFLPAKFSRITGFLAPMTAWTLEIGCAFASETILPVM
jgi:hypothetical protein